MVQRRAHCRVIRSSCARWRRTAILRRRRSTTTASASHDVFELVANPGAGWGDPLDARPDARRADLREGRVRANEAEEIYGVIVGDPAATTAATR